MESRELMTGGVGNTFALMPGSVAAANQPAEIRFTLAPGSFSRPGGKVVVGIDVTPQTNSTVDPQISGVGVAGEVQTAASGPRARAAAQRNGIQVARTQAATAILATFKAARGRNAVTPQDFYVNVAGKSNTTGNLVVGFYLPGDANGDGVVNQTDTNAVRKLIGTTVNHTAYSFDADANRDGIINNTDLSYTRINKGAKTTISPVLTANLDPASDTGEADRITTKSDVKFTGVASPGATIVYTEVAGRTPNFTTTADASGNYTLNTKLATGVNTFKVSSADAFGQVISGQITPVIVQAA
jgi:hypothetical protein